MYRRIEDFTAEWAEEAENTLKVFRNLTDEASGQRVTPDGRSAGRLAWHIATSVPQMAGEAGLKGVEGPVNDQGDIPPMAEVVATYETAARTLGDAVRSQWSDDEMGDLIPMYGEMWSKGRTLSILVGHQAHHRGQLTVLMRQAGLAVPGCYGPSREEWATYGMQAMD